MTESFLKIPTYYLLYLGIYVLFAPVISGFMAAFILNKEFPNREYLWKVCISTIVAFCGIVFSIVYIPMFLMWMGMYYLNKSPYKPYHEIPNRFNRDELVNSK